MPVRKFRSVEEMNQPVWRSPGDPDLYRTMAGVWDVGQACGRDASSPACTAFGALPTSKPRPMSRRRSRRTDYTEAWRARSS